MEPLRERPQLAGEETTPTAGSPTVYKSQPQSFLVPAGSLTEQCRGCSNELQRLAKRARKYIGISISGKLKDVRLRLDIWMSDIDIEKGTLNESDAFKQSRLFSVITTALQRMNSHLEAVGKDIETMRFEFQLRKKAKQVALP